MDTKILLDSVNGKDINGDSKCSLTMAYSRLDKDNNRHVVMETDSTNCEVLMTPLEKNIMIELKFNSNLDIDLIAFWDTIQMYKDDMRILSQNTEECPILELTIVPVEFKCQVYTVAINPLFAVLTNTNVHATYNNTIALVFNTDENFFIMEPENFDASEFIAAAEREAEEMVRKMQEDEIERMKREVENEQLKNDYYNYNGRN